MFRLRGLPCYYRGKGVKKEVYENTKQYDTILHTERNQPQSDLNSNRITLGSGQTRTAANLSGWPDQRVKRTNKRVHSRTNQREVAVSMRLGTYQSVTHAFLPFFRHCTISRKILLVQKKRLLSVCPFGRLTDRPPDLFFFYADNVNCH